MLLQEFEEETGGVASLVETVEPLGLVYDALYGVYDLFYRLVVKSPLEELTGCVSQRGEYRRLACVTVPELKAWLSDFRKPFVPPVRTMLSQLLACMDAL